MSAASAGVLTDLTLGLDLAGVAANALLGAVKAREHHLDLFGITVVAIASGDGQEVGAGTIRRAYRPDGVTQLECALGAVAQRPTPRSARRIPGRDGRTPADVPFRAAMLNSESMHTADQRWPTQ